MWVVSEINLIREISQTRAQSMAWSTGSISSIFCHLKQGISHHYVACWSLEEREIENPKFITLSRSLNYGPRYPSAVVLRRPWPPFQHLQLSHPYAQLPPLPLPSAFPLPIDLEQRHHPASLPDLRARLHPLLGLPIKREWHHPFNPCQQQQGTTRLHCLIFHLPARSPSLLGRPEKRIYNFKASSFHFHLSWDDGQWLNCPVPRQNVNNDRGQGKHKTTTGVIFQQLCSSGLWLEDHFSHHQLNNLRSEMKTLFSSN
jgi:hypothetical protein